MTPWWRWNGNRKRRGGKRIRSWGIRRWGEWGPSAGAEAIDHHDPEAEERAEGKSSISH